MPVTRSIQECYMTAVLERYVVCTDVLGDTASLTGDYVSLTDIVQQRSLTVVDMTHHRNNRRTWNQI